MKKYEPQKFIEAFYNKTKKKGIPNCPYCGGSKFTTTDKYAPIIISTDIGNVNFGPSIPAGMIICETCGHIEFFALGALGLLEKSEDGEKDGK